MGSNCFNDGICIESHVGVDRGADLGYRLVAIFVKHASMGSNCFNDGIGIESHVGAAWGADRGY